MTEKSMTGKELGEKLLESVRQMKAGEGTVVYSPVIAARQKSGLSQSQFAELMGVSLKRHGVSSNIPTFFMELLYAFKQRYQ
jgi:DNA-binding transcriptional regulator YiaG